MLMSRSYGLGTPCTSPPLAVAVTCVKTQCREVSALVNNIIVNNIINVIVTSSSSSTTTTARRGSYRFGTFAKELLLTAPTLFSPKPPPPPCPLLLPPPPTAFSDEVMRLPSRPLWPPPCSLPPLWPPLRPPLPPLPWPAPNSRCGAPLSKFAAAGCCSRDRRPRCWARCLCCRCCCCCCCCCCCSHRRPCCRSDLGPPFSSPTATLSEPAEAFVDKAFVDKAFVGQASVGTAPGVKMRRRPLVATAAKASAGAGGGAVASAEADFCAWSRSSAASFASSA